MRIMAVYDNNGKTLDRYTVITDQPSRPGSVVVLGVSSNPEDYNGFSQWGEIVKTLDYKRLGEQISFESLSGRVQEHIAIRVFAEE